MARQTIKTSTRGRRRRARSGYRKCNMCHGTGYIRVKSK